ncbi:MAG: GH3 auxin-responsive promoter family protein, partial [Bacteroidales bacterium]
MKAGKIINKIFLKAEKKLLLEIDKSKKEPFEYQHSTFNTLINCGKETLFGIEHRFGDIKSVKNYQQNVPISDYNGLANYVNRIRSGEDYILWNQKVKWFAKSSGTSSDKSKFIPVTEDSLKYMHFKGMTSMLANYINTHPDSSLFTGKALTLGGSVKPDEMGNGKSLYGDLSAVMLKNTPAIVEFARAPKRKTALIADFNEKVEKICKQCSKQNITSFSGVPSWNLILLNKVLEYNHKENLLELWPNLELFMHGGIGFEPYRELYNKIIPKETMHYLENYNASEGYFAFQ